MHSGRVISNVSWHLNWPNSPVFIGEVQMHFWHLFKNLLYSILVRTVPDIADPQLEAYRHEYNPSPSTHAADSLTPLQQWTSPYNRLAQVNFNTCHSSGGRRSSPQLSSATHHRSSASITALKRYSEGSSERSCNISFFYVCTSSVCS